MSEYAKTEDPPNGAPTTGEPRRRALAMPDGWLGILLLMLLASAFGGVIAVYWPWSNDSGVSDERVAALEAQVNQLAAGHGGAAASGVFADLKRNVAGLSTRIDADEARLTALEKASSAGPATAETSALHDQLGDSASVLAQLNARIVKLETTGGSPAQVADLVAKVTALQARVTALDADVARTAGTNKGALDAISLRLAKIEAALPPDLAARLDALAPKADVAAFNARIARLEQSNAGDTLHRAAAILALADLAQAANDGRPFTLELETLAAAQPNDPAIAAMKPYAVRGVPTVAALRARFPETARKAVDVLRAVNTTDTMSRFWSNLAGLISVRRVGDVQGNSPDARLARAQARLNANDLAGAAGEVAAIGPPSSVALAPWLKDARARVALDALIVQVNARIVRAIAAARNEGRQDGTQ